MLQTERTLAISLGSLLRVSVGKHGGLVVQSCWRWASDDAVYLGQRVQNWGLEGGMAVGIMGFAWLVVSVRCAGCGGHPAWYLMRKAEVGKWFTLLVSLLACPMCGRRPENQGGGNTQRVMSSRVG